MDELEVRQEVLLGVHPEAKLLHLRSTDFTPATATTATINDSHRGARGKRRERKRRSRTGEKKAWGGAVGQQQHQSVVHQFS